MSPPSKHPLVLVLLLACTFTCLASKAPSHISSLPLKEVCANQPNQQCGGVSPEGGAWEVELSSCCPLQHVCSYKTMYYSECIRVGGDKSGEVDSQTQHGTQHGTQAHELNYETNSLGDDAGQKRTLTESVDSISNAVDGFFMLINAQIIFFMQGGETQRGANATSYCKSYSKNFN